MKHLDDEDIAGLIDGTVNKKERKTFLKHLSQCKDCLTVYSETLKFIEDEKAVRVPFGEKLKITLQGVWESMGTLVPIKILIPTAAALVFILLITPILLNQLRQTGIRNHQVEFIAGRVTKTESYALAPSNDEVYAAVRAGIFVEDLSLLVNISKEKELKTKVAGMLSSQLELFDTEEKSLSRDAAHIEKKNFESVVQRIRELLENRSLYGPFQLGRFVEQSILSTFEGKIPGPEVVEEFLQIARKYETKFPVGVFKELNQMKKSTESLEIRKRSGNIRKIFFD